jgi:ABC-type lipoprotein release transport system permease subunit
MDNKWLYLIWAVLIVGVVGVVWYIVGGAAMGVLFGALVAALGYMLGRFHEQTAMSKGAELALLLAAVGTYGVLAQMVTERRREIGIRMALGAARSHVLARIMKQGLQLTAIGIAAGLAGALALNRLIASLLFGVQPTDAVTIALVIATITAVAVAASWLPAWRASRLDPNTVLRNE